MKYTWSILEISAKNEVIDFARYKTVIENGEFSVETEGNWWFTEPTLKVPFVNVTEEMVISWIQKETMKDGVNLIESRLKEQLETLKEQESVIAPWLPQVFTPQIQEFI